MCACGGLQGPRVDGVKLSVPVSKKRNASDGTWTCAYTTALAGLYKLQILLNGRNVQGSPFFIISEPAALCIERSNCVGEALAGRWHVGNPAKFVITSRDEFGNKLRSGGAEFVVRCVAMAHGRLHGDRVGSVDRVYVEEPTPREPSL